ncbi:ABC transporter substrate-binding protein [Actinomycetota bacterium]
MKLKTRTIIKFLIIIFYLTVSLMLMLGCSVEDLGLLPSNGLDDEEEILNNFESNLSEEELFLEMKARQDKNRLSDLDIRKAIFHSVDRIRIVDELFGVYGQVANSLFPVSSPYWDQSWSEYDYDLEKAKEYLSKAGYGVDNPLYLTISSVDNSETKQIIENIIKEDLKKIGINLWIFNSPPKELYQDRICSGDYELGLWSMFVFDEDNINTSFASNKIPPMETEENTDCENFYWYKSTEIDDLLKQAYNLSDSGILKDKLIEIQDILARDAVILPLYSRLFVLAYSNDLRQVDLNVLGEKPFLNIDEWKLVYEAEVPEGEKTEIGIGYESDLIDIFNGFEKYFINDLIFKGLWKNNPDGSYKAILLEDFNQDEEEYSGISGLNLNVKLKDEIFWQDGDPITSYDIKYTFDYFKTFMEESEYFSRLDEDYKKIEEIKILNEKEFTISFNERMDDWQKLFDQVYKESSFDYYDPYNFPYEKIISNGPYQIEEYDKDGRLVFEINENYYGEIPEIERLIIRFDPDINNLIAMLKENEIDALSVPVDLELIKELEQEENIKLVIKPGNLMEHLALSLKPSE